MKCGKYVARFTLKGGGIGRRMFSCENCSMNDSLNLIDLLNYFARVRVRGGDGGGTDLRNLRIFDLIGQHYFQKDSSSNLLDGFLSSSSYSFRLLRSTHTQTQKHPLPCLKFKIIYDPQSKTPI